VLTLALRLAVIIAFLLWHAVHCSLHS
jgi:hypothetical protein